MRSSLILRNVFPAAALLAAVACSTVNETGRSRFAWLPASTMDALGASAYAEATSQYPQKTGPDADMVQRVGERIAKTCGYTYDWEFKLLDAPNVVNAFALPGGKVAVYSGLLPITRNEDALAAVMGHEIAHVTAEHGNERMTQNYIASFGMAAVDAAVGSWSDISEESRAGIMAALAAGVQYGAMLPFSRQHESEADEIGLRFLIRAGYDPQEAPRLWDRMADAESPDAAQTPEFMRTHPNSRARAQRLRELIPIIELDEKQRREAISGQ